MMRRFYNFTLRMATLIAIPVLPVLLLSKKVRTGFLTRLGWLSKEDQSMLKDLVTPRLWFHAASVGELSVVAPIVRYLKEHNATMSIIVTTTSVSGLNHVKNKLPEVDISFLAPLDYPSVVKRIVKLIAPSILIVTETELWPNLILTAKEFRSQLALVNGRLSEKNVGRYRFMGSLIRRVLEQFELLTIQSESDANRFIQLGANAQRVKIISNVKSDNHSKMSKAQIRATLCLSDEQLVWVAGSTRPGEEPIILKAFSEISKALPNVILILAPRHLDRLKEVERLLIDSKMSYIKRSQINECTDKHNIILLDTMGELADIYGCSQVAFVGGTLAAFGGHNPLEPALHGVPILLGPHTEHFAKMTTLLIESRGAKQINQEHDLATEVIRLLSHPGEAQEMGKRAKQAVADVQGSASKTAKSLMKLMLIKKWALEVKTWRQDSIKKNNYNQKKETFVDDEWLVR